VGKLLKIQRLIFFISADPKAIATTNGSGEVGSIAELSCTYTGRPVPIVKWLGFGKEVSPTRDPQKYHISTLETSETKITSRLKIMRYLIIYILGEMERYFWRAYKVGC
jgi:hypothetical protein